MKHLKTISMCCLAGCIILGTGCHINLSLQDGYSFNFKGDTATREESEEISSATKRINVVNKFGRVVVKSTTGTPKWNWEIKCWADDSVTAETLTKQTKLQRSSNSELLTLELELPEPSSDFNGAESILFIAVPAGTEIICTNSFGPVEMTGISNQISVTNRHGHVKLVDNEGKLQVECSHGDVSIDGAGEVVVEGKHCEIKASRIKGDVDLKTTHDNLTIDRVIGSVSAEVAHGDVSVSKIEGGFRCRLSHGDLKGSCNSPSIVLRGRHAEIKLTATNPELQNIDASTTHDDIRLTLSSEIVPTLDYNVSHGDIDSDFKMDDPSGRTRVKLDTSHGDIVVRKQ